MAENTRRAPVVRVTHPGVFGCEEFSPEVVANPAEAVKAFRAKHGRINTVHPYIVTVEKDGGSKEFQINVADLVDKDKEAEKASKKAARK